MTVQKWQRSSKLGVHCKWHIQSFPSGSVWRALDQSNTKLLLDSSQENGRIVMEEEEEAALGFLRKWGGGVGGRKKSGRSTLSRAHPPLSAQSNQWLCLRASAINSGIDHIKNVLQKKVQRVFTTEAWPCEPNVQPQGHIKRFATRYRISSFSWTKCIFWIYVTKCSISGFFRLIITFLGAANV